eukprot:jgi/Antlo1/1542/1303
MLKKAYTYSYNLVGILVIVYGLASAVMYQIYKKKTYLFRAGLSQTFFIVEIFNILVGASRSTYSPTLIQVMSRLYVVWVIAYMHSLQNVMLTVMLVCWNISDLIRYMFYLSHAGWLKKLRYNAFIVLYPLGISLEIYMINCAYMMYDDKRSWIFGATMLLYFPLFPYLYYHMIKQRRRTNKIFEGRKKKKHT